MLAYEIEIDGEKYITVGVEDWSILSVHVTASRSEENAVIKNDYIEFSAHGLSSPNEENICHHFRWSNANLQIGNIVKIKIIDTSLVDMPKKRYRSDSKVQESPYTDEECQEMEYQDYLRLKEKFESGD